MARNIIIVNATQLVTSEAHPEGLFSTMSEFPKTFDSVNYSDDVEKAMRAAKSAYFDQLSKNYANSNENRVMTTVTLEMANGRQIMSESIGAFPVIAPQVEPETPEEDMPADGE